MCQRYGVADKSKVIHKFKCHKHRAMLNQRLHCHPVAGCAYNVLICNYIDLIDAIFAEFGQTVFSFHCKQSVCKWKIVY